MSKVGRRGKSKKKIEPSFGIGDQVKAQFDGEWYKGVVQLIDKSTAQVLFEDGEQLEMQFADLKSVKKNKVKKNEDGFDQYDLKWNEYKSTFSIKAEDILFYGHLIKGQYMGAFSFSISIRAKFASGDIHVEDLRYIDGDPRENVNSMNADICCAVSKWFYYHCQGNPVETIQDLRKKSSRPLVKINSLEAIDTLIESLKQTRQVAIKCGGVRYCTIESNNKPEESPVVTIQVDLSKVANMYQATGKVPQHVSGGMIESAISTRGKKSKIDSVKNSNGGKSTKLDKATLKELLGKIEKCKEDVALKKYRKMLRSMGIKGGVNGLKRLIEEKN